MAVGSCGYVWPWVLLTVGHLGFDGFCLPWPLWVLGLMGLVHRSILHLPLCEASLSSLVCLFVFFFFFLGYRVDFWMDADCGGSGFVMGLGLLLSDDG